MEFIAPVLSFAVSTTITPGPNNVMVTASGANFGYRRTLRHILGISLGFPVMVVAVGLGLGGLFQALPEVHIVLKFLGCAYILWMAWKIAAADGMGGSGARPGKPFTWVNPKAWVMAVGAITAYTSVGGYYYLEIALIALIFLVVCIPSISIWTLFGVGIGRMLTARKWLKIFNAAMALLLVASLIPVFLAWGP
ncbi:MAG: LysE family translocator [Nitrospinae bacterium]|nr:LysE family translocator [Nitrospinota bacterium]